MKKIAIFTNDSEIQLPEIHKWKNTLGKGSNIENNQYILDILKKSNLKIPEDDINLEHDYKNKLIDFVRPARLMFAHSFGEIRTFFDDLRKISSIELFVVSGRYGLLKENDDIIPYHVPLKTVDDIKKLNNRTNFLKDIDDVSSGKQIIIMSFPSFYFQFFIEEGWFEKIGTNLIVYAISGNNIKSRLLNFKNITFFNRKGVVRIGKHNQEKIINVIINGNKNKEKDIL